MGSVPRESLEGSSTSQMPFAPGNKANAVYKESNMREAAFADTSNPSTTQSLREKLQQARTDLLDLTLRNNMLHFRLPKRLGVNLLAQSTSLILSQLVEQHAALRFEATLRGETDAHQEDVEQLFMEDTVVDDDEEMDTDQIGRSSEVRPTKSAPILFAPYTVDQLQNRLLQTFRAARTLMEEQGANTLFLATGFLEWYEASSSDKALMAPLLLLPVQLERDTVRDQFTLKYNDDEVVENLSLQYRLTVDFQIALPTLDGNEPESTIDRFFAEVENAIGKQERWRVHRDKLMLGFFSFGKYLMFRDLDPGIWPEAASPLLHPILASLLGEGFDAEPSSVDPNARLDDVVTLADMRTVLDADSSQLKAIVDVSRGRNLVIQGPPGTGKSQTITNMIARAVMDGKSVLFVAEKMAALDVVKRRLEQVGLGAACLELHSNKTNKRQLLLELDRTWQVKGTDANEVRSEEQAYLSLRQKLNEYIDIMHQPMAASGVTPYHAMGTIVRFHDVAVEENWPIFTVQTTWTQETFVDHVDLLSDLQAFLSGVGVLQTHPFWGSTIDEIQVGSDLRRIATILEESITALEAMQREWADLLGNLEISYGDTWRDVDRMCTVLHRLQTAPDVSGIDVTAEAWRTQAATLHDVAKAMLQIGTMRQKYEGILVSATWQKDLSRVRTHIFSHKSSFLRVLSGEYKAALTEAKACLRHAQKQSVQEVLSWMDDVIETQEQIKEVMRHDGLLHDVLGQSWRGEETDWLRITGVIAWLLQWHADVINGDWPDWVMIVLRRSGVQKDATAWVSTLRQRLEETQHKVRAVKDALKWKEVDADVTDWAQAIDHVKPAFGRSMAVDGQRMRQWLSAIDQLPSIILWNKYVQKCDSVQLQSVTQVASTWRHAGTSLVDAFRFRWYEALLQKTFQDHEALAHFAGSTHDSVIERFGQLDEGMTRATQQLAKKAHLARIPAREGGGELSVLRREIQKKARHMPIRKLLRDAGHAIQGIKPIFMASPLSVSTYLPPGSLAFDLVVFDEASQVLPTDAFGSLLRGRQLVVVGDSKQLPPTNFFDVAMEDDEEAQEAEIRTSDMESILGLCVSQGMPECMLRWHYRSRHESLIAVSNAEFYDGRLVVFPSPNASSQATGLVLHHRENTVYDRGKTRTNRLEARAVAEAVLQHARSYVDGESKETLGVVAFSSAQASAIEDEVDRLRRKSPETEAFFSASTEHFFVKNLETVQGDERDVIFISVGYGRDQNGYLAMSFGPLGKSGGERRLNVLISRARMRCEVFTNLRADDIDLHRTKGEGTRIFKTFLKYCETGILDVPHSTEREMDSPFEVAVRDELVSRGYQVDVQVGTAGFFIDLAVIDVDKPGRYLLGIECDGRTYHSSQSARDRDRLRQRVLEGLGWRLHRIWSTDWFHDKRHSVDRLIQAIEQAKLEGKNEKPQSTKNHIVIANEQGNGLSDEQQAMDRQGSEDVNAFEAKKSAGESGTPPVASKSIAVPYVVSDLVLRVSGVELHEVPVPTMANWIRQVVNVEAPVHVDVVARRIADAWGVKRVGNRIQATFHSAIHYAIRQSLVEKREGEFLFRLGQTEIPLRSRVHLASGERKMNWIASAEIAGVISALIDKSYGYAKEDLIIDSTRELGFLRATQEMRDIVAKIVDELYHAGSIKLEGINYVKG